MRVCEGSEPEGMNAGQAVYFNAQVLSIEVMDQIMKRMGSPPPLGAHNRYVLQF